MSTKHGQLLRSLLVVSAVVLAGCTIRHGDFTVISTKLVNTKEFDLSRADRVKGVTGTDRSHIIVFVPTKMQVTLKEALDDALAKGKGDVITDATIEFWHWYIPYIYGSTGWEVKGDVVKTRQK